MADRRPDKIKGPAEADGGSIKPEKTKAELEREAAELEVFRLEAQAFVDSYKSLLVSFAGDSSLTFKIGRGFFIDLATGEVNLDVKWFKEKGFSHKQILWAIFHEISHFRDLAADPENMMKGFAYARAQARKTGAVMFHKWEQKYGTSDPELMERLKRRRPVSQENSTETMSAIDWAAYKMHHTFLNVFDDVFVNADVSERAPAYGRNREGGQEIERLYKEKLFPTTDYRSLPRHLQFLYVILRQAMVPDEEVQVGEEVAQLLKDKIIFLGKSLTPQEVVALYTKPSVGRNTKAGNRLFILKQTLEPIFLKLLAQDLEEWEPERPPEPEQGNKGEEGNEAGDPNPFKNDYDEFAKNSPDQLDGDQIRDWVNKREADKKEAAKKAAAAKKEAEKTPAQKAAEERAALDKRWCAETGVSEKSLQRFRETESIIEPHLDELSALWERIIYGAGREFKWATEGHFKTGTDLDVGRVVAEWSNIAKGQLDEVRVMKRRVSKEQPVNKPELIRVRIVADLSGSMDGAKKRILEQCVVLLLSSLREFNNKLQSNSDKTKSKLRVDTQAWAFGNQAKQIKSFQEGSDVDERIKIARIFEQLDQDLGSTYDHKALEAINDSLNDEERAQVVSGRIMEIVFEITDGGSSDPEASREAVDGLSQKGVITRAFQIGAVSEGEKEVFDQVWNDKREEPFGQIIGEDIAQLIPAVVTALKNFLSGVKL